MGSSAICSIEGCGKSVCARGYCGCHYRRVQKHGDPLVALIGKDGPMWAFLTELLATAPREDCVTWPFGRTTRGRGQMRVGCRKHIASRYVCEKAHGAPPKPGYDARHLCGNGHLGCVNPAHLAWGTRAENVADSIRHGTHPRGERNGSSKLTELQARQIIACRDAGESQSKIAADFGVSRTTVRNIHTGRGWAWLQQG